MTTILRSILESPDRAAEEGTVRELLRNCVDLLDSTKFPHIATSAHFLLSELYVPEGTDPAKPGFVVGEEGEPEQPEQDVGEQASVDVNTLCLPSPPADLWATPRPPPISATAADRCHAALKHLALGLQFLSR